MYKWKDVEIHEANLLHIPVIGMVDTNCDPRNVDYIIPSNDDAIRAIKLLVAKMADAVIEGRSLRKEEEQKIPEERVAILTEEPELSDEELLGEATLAKLTTREVEVQDDQEISEGSEEDEVEEEEIDDEEEVLDEDQVEVSEPVGDEPEMTETTPDQDGEIVAEEVLEKASKEDYLESVEDAEKVKPEEGEE